MGGFIVDRVVGDLYVLRINDYRTRFFEATWNIPEGITYNAYLLKTSEGDVLFDGWKHGYEAEFLEALSMVTSLDNIRYLVVHHAEPDHSGTHPLILREARNATVLGHPMAKRLLESLHGIRVGDFRAVRNGEEIEIGGHRLRFIHAPMLHWPETIFTYIPEYKALLTCDAFGGYGVPRTLYDEDDEEIHEYMFYVKKYLVTVIGFHRKNINTNIEKLRKAGAELGIIAPAHGLIWRNNPDYIVKYYDDTAKAVGRRKVTIMYTSMYGHIEEAAMHAADEASKAGYKVKVYPFTDQYHSEWGNILTDIIDSDLIVVGGATYDTSIVPPTLAFLSILVNRLPNIGKKVIIISSYGWGGLAANKMKEILKQTNYTIVDTIQFNGKPRKEDIEKIREAIRKAIGKQ